MQAQPERLRRRQDAYRKGNEVETIRRNTGSSNRSPPVNIKKLAEEKDVVPVTELPH